jgi:hypothetical protein
MHGATIKIFSQPSRTDLTGVVRSLYSEKFIFAPTEVRPLHAVTQRLSCRSSGANGEHRVHLHVCVRTGTDHLTVASKSITY